MKKDLRHIKLLNIEEFIIVNYYILCTKFLVFKNKDLLDKCNIIYDYFIYSFNIERNLLNILLKNVNKINTEELVNILNMLDELNEGMIVYIYNSLDAICDAYQLSQSWRFNFKSDEFKLLKEKDNILFNIYCSLITFDDLLSFMQLPDDFINYLKTSVDIIRYNSFDCDTFFYGVYPKFSEKDLLEKYKIIIPEIKNLKTILINVHELKHAYDMYLLLGSKLPDDLDQYEKDARHEENIIKNRIYNGGFNLWKKRNKVK